VSVKLQSLPFDPGDAKGALVQLPSGPAVFALYGAEARDEPYIGRTPNLRVRLEKLLQPSAITNPAINGYSALIYVHPSIRIRTEGRWGGYRTGPKGPPLVSPLQGQQQWMEGVLQSVAVVRSARRRAGTFVLLR
jgi:hypothetical protein